MDSRLAKLKDKALSLGETPGCYLMKNKKGEVIYVGKAKNLKARVSSYFNQSDKTPKTEILVSHIDDFDFMLTRNDAEAFVLENNLIKKHAPKYNIRLKDDRSYPYVRIDRRHPFPRLEYVRRPRREKGVELHGPFPTGTNIAEVLRILVKSFALRDCNDREFAKRKTPCLLYQMKQCTAPCVRYIDETAYAQSLSGALAFFSNRSNESMAMLEKKMDEFAESESFEAAAIIRDNLALLRAFLDQSRQREAERFDGPDDLDVMAYVEGETEIDWSLYMLRRGMLLGHKHFFFRKTDLGDSVHELVMNHLLQYYSVTLDVLPKKLIHPFDDADDFGEALKISTGIRLQSPGRRYKALLALTLDHARESQRIRIKHEASVWEALHRLKELLNLRESPRVIECVDIAVWQGHSPTASQVVFHDGVPDKTRYRYYHLETRDEGNNDFAMLAEMIERRLHHAHFPDLFLIDGGMAQVNAVQRVLSEHEVSIPVVGIAKARSENESEERLIIPGRSNPYILNKCPPLFKLMVQMRDEAHRFARKLHHKAEHDRLFESNDVE